MAEYMKMMTMMIVMMVITFSFFLFIVFCRRTDDAEARNVQSLDPFDVSVLASHYASV